MSSHTTALPSPELAARQRPKRTAGRLFRELLVPAAGTVFSIMIVRAALPIPTICGMELIVVISAFAIVVRALLRSQLAAFDQLLFGAHSLLIALFLTVVPAEFFVLFMGYESLFSPVATIQRLLSASLVLMLELTLYYWVIYMCWDRVCRSIPRRVWLTVLSASAIQTVFFVVSASVASNLQTLLMPVYFAAVYGPPVIWILNLAREERLTSNGGNLP